MKDKSHDNQLWPYDRLQQPNLFYANWFFPLPFPYSFLQMKGKNGSWMANGWSGLIFPCLCCQIHSPLLLCFILSLRGWSLSTASSGLPCSWIFCSGQPVISTCWGLESGREAGEVKVLFPHCLCSEVIPPAESLPHSRSCQAAPPPRFPLSHFLCLSLYS